jgi:hypothetical protein
MLRLWTVGRRAEYALLVQFANLRQPLVSMIRRAILKEARHTKSLELLDPAPPAWDSIMQIVL